LTVSEKGWTNHSAAAEVLYRPARLPRRCGTESNEHRAYGSFAPQALENAPDDARIVDER
jgi:hypothetical protein